LGIIDDPVSGREDADSERMRDRTWAWYKDDFLPRLKPNAAIVLIMQRWHEDDLAGRLLKDAESGGDQWTVVKLTMEAEENDPLGRQVGELLWKEWFTQEMAEQAKRDPRTWLALYQQSPRPESGGEFKREWIQYYKSKPHVREVNTYVLIDPSSGKKRTQGDFTAGWVVGLGKDGNYYVLDAVRDRLNLTERAELVFRWHKEYKPITIAYEDYGMQADIDHLKDKMEKEQYRFHITPVKGALKKEDRVRRLISDFEANRFYFPESLNRTDSSGKMRDLVKDFIEEEYLAFPVGMHDDSMDSLSRIKDLSLRWPQEAKKPQHERKFAVITGRNGWMA
jgi:predicted phage terminase large subunit-like protein